MSLDRRGVGLAVVRIFIGVFFVSQGLIKLHWFGDPSDLAGRFDSYLELVGAGSPSGWYLEHVAIPWTAVFARLVPLGELGCGLAMVIGFRTSLAALTALFMVANFHFASGAFFVPGFFTNAHGLPVLGSLFALLLGGLGLPLSVSSLKTKR